MHKNSKFWNLLGSSKIMKCRFRQASLNMRKPKKTDDIPSCLFLKPFHANDSNNVPYTKCIVQALSYPKELYNVISGQKKKTDYIPSCLLLKHLYESELNNEPHTKALSCPKELYNVISEQNYWPFLKTRSIFVPPTPLKWR